MDRSEHLQLCKDRALEYVERGDIAQAIASMASDLNKHDGTRNHSGIEMGMMLLASGHLNNSLEARNFIEGFN